MKNVSRKYTDIMTTGKELFWKFGLKRVTVEEICEQANVSKMTFYKYFENKDNLAMEIVRSLLESTMEEFFKMMESDIPFQEKVEATVKMKMAQAGSISKEFLADLYTGDYPELQKYVEMKTRENLNILMNFYRRAQEKGEIRKEIKIEFLMYMLNQMIAMASDEKLTSQYDTGGELVMELTNLFFYGVLPCGEGK